jgi:ribosome-binding protein aMBF1 (putative translation factor)
MFNFFRKNRTIDRLEKRYNELVREAYELSTSNRQLSDQRVAESNEVLKQIELLEREP